MVELQTPITPESIENLILQWFDLLAEERYEEALAMVLQDPHFPYTPDLLKTLIENKGWPPNNGPRHKVTNWRSAEGDREKHRHMNTREVPKGDDLGSVFYDLPLDGEWSNMTAMFTINAYQGKVVLAFIEFHVSDE